MSQKNINHIEKLVEEIGKRSNNKRFVVAVSGFAGAGKSTISGKLASILKNSLVIHVDDFIIADENGAKPGYPHDWENFERLVLSKLRDAPKVTSRTFDWKSNKIVDESIEVQRYIVVDGPSELFQDAFSQYLDLLVWVDVPQDIANARGMKRDREKYNVDHDDLWKTVWSPKEIKNFNVIRPDLKADFLIEN